MRSLLPPSIAAVVIAVVALALGQSRASVSTKGSSAVVTGKLASIKIANYAYQPTALTVRAGTKITVTNSDQTAHTATARTGAFDSGTVTSGKPQSFTVTKPGVYHYYCQFHAFMSGTITVIK